MTRNKLLIGFEKRASEVVHGGLAAGKPDSAYPASQLRKGTKVEMEHTKSPALAKEIAKDHLEENKKYYTHLEKMEKEMDKKGSCKEKSYKKQNKFRPFSNNATGDSHILAESETIRE